MKQEILSISNPKLALKRLIHERELRTDYHWTMKDGRTIPVRSMTDEHLDATIAMLQRMVSEREIIGENQTEVLP